MLSCTIYTRYDQCCLTLSMCVCLILYYACTLPALKMKKTFDFTEHWFVGQVLL